MKKNVAKLLALSGLTLSVSEAKRKVMEGAVALNGQPVRDMQAELQLQPGDRLSCGRKEVLAIQDCGDETYCCCDCDLAEELAKQERENGREVSVTGNMVFVF